MEWTTVALIALAVIAAIVILWLIIFVVFARHVFRFQKKVTDQVFGDDAPKPLGTPRPNPRFTRERQRRERGEL